MQHLENFLEIWGKQFYDFMWGWGLEIIRATVYMSLGLGFICVALEIPPQILQLFIPQLFGVIVGITLTVNVVVSVWRLFNPDEDEAEPGPAAKPREATT